MTDHELCPRCNRTYPSTQLACPYCVERISNAAYRELQRKFIAQVVADIAELTLVYIPGNGSDRPWQWHLQRFADIRHAYCNENLLPGWRQDHLRYGELHQVSGFCPKCEAALIELANAPEAHVEVQPEAVQACLY